MQELKYLNKDNAKYYLKDNGNIEVHLFTKNINEISPQSNSDTTKNSVATYISKKNGDKNYNELDKMMVGVTSDDIYRSLVKFNLPTIGTASNLVSAYLNIVSHKDDYKVGEVLAEGLVTINELTSNVDFNKVTWNNFENKYNEYIEFYSPILRSVYNVDGITLSNNSIDITNLVKGWYSGKPNYGLLIKNYKEEYDKDISPFSFYTDNTTVTGEPKPTLILEFKNFNGLEDYLSYQSFSGTGFTSYINNLTGNLINVFGLNSTKLGKCPISLSMYYNTNDCLLNKTNSFVKGFKLNYYSYLKEVDDNTIEYLDFDGTIHYLIKNENAYYDTDGLNINVVKKDEKYELADKTGNKCEFTSINNVYYLTLIKDTINNNTSITYENEKIIKVTDTDNKSINITYNENNIVITSKYLTTTLNLIDNKIKSIVNKFGTVVIEYNGDYISKITGINSQSINFTYYDTAYKIKKAERTGLNNEVGESISFEYLFDSTKVTDNVGHINTYSFNTLGNTISVYSTKDENNIDEFMGVSNVYGDDNSNKNKLILSNSSFKFTNNLFSDCSFENTKLGTWDNNAIISDEYANTGKQSLKVMGEQQIKLPHVPETGTYTLSAYFKSNHAMELNVWQDKKCISETKRILQQTEFVRQSFTVTIEKDKEYYLNVFPVDNAIIYVDDIQLEKGEVANLINYVRNADFSMADKWWQWDPTDNIELMPNGTDIFHRICEYDKEKTLSQKINISGKKGDSFRLSFWYKNNGIIDLESGGSYQGQVVVFGFAYKNINDGSEYPIGNLKRHNNSWQYFDEVYVAIDDYDYIDLSFLSIAEVNDLYIANVSIIKDLGNSAYSYDDTGNLISCTSPNNSKTVFKYDKNNELTKAFTPSGSNFSIEYDNTKTSKILSGTSSDGVSNSLTYDDYNNPIKTTIKHNGLTDEVEDNVITIRQKGTKKYLKCDYFDCKISLEEPKCSIDTWQITHINDDYYLKGSVLPYYFNVHNNEISLVRTMGEATKIKLETHINGTYSILIKDTNKCLVYKNNKLTIDDYIEDNFINEFYFENTKYKKFIETKATYSKDGRLLESTTDSLDKVTKYDIDALTCLTKSVTDTTGNKTEYLYNDKEQLTKVTKNNNSIEYKYTNDNLSSIILGNKTYNFTYDNFLNTKEVKINNITLVTNEYEKNNGSLVSIKYGNNTNINYTYDYLDRVDTITKDTNKYQYAYDNLGRLAKIKSNEYTYNYYYDLASRLVKYDTVSDNETNSIEYIYDKNNNIVKKKYDNNIVEYTYNKDDIITKVTLDNNELNYNYDDLNRLESKNINDNLRVEYTYYNLGNKTSYLLHTLKIDTDTYEYIYDDLYNIIKINLNNKVLNEYEYDINNQLLVDNNYSNNITYKYTYDNYGNILSKSTYKLNTTTLINTDTYTYDNANYKDQLTKFNNDTITYDGIGNPLKIGNTTYNWSNGRELQSISNTNLNVSYKYDRNGIRTKKILNNEEISYCLENTSIVIEKHKDYMLYFLRDDSNNLLGFTYKNKSYYYKKNAFDDIIGIYDSNYKEVCTYNYDAYGNILSIKDNTGKDITDTSNVAIINPFRYRSYYYDTETNLYYLNSRYYSPKMGRFINCDTIVSTTAKMKDYNLYAYCSNNPVNQVDSNGKFGKLIGSLLSRISGVFEKTVGLFGSTNYVSHSVDIPYSGVNHVIPFVGGYQSSVDAKLSTGDVSSESFIQFSKEKTDTGTTRGVKIGPAGVSISSDRKSGIKLGLSFTKNDGKYELTDYSVSFGFTFDLRTTIGTGVSHSITMTNNSVYTMEYQNEFSFNKHLVNGFQYAWNGVASGVKSAVNIIKDFGHRITKRIPIVPLPAANCY